MSSSIPGAVQAFITMMDPAQGGALPVGTQVWFGKALSRYIAPVTLQIVEVHGDQEPAELGPDYRREEVYAIACILTSWAGDNNHIARMTDVFAKFAIVTKTVANNPTLNGNVRFAQPKSLDYIPDADAKGLVVGQLTFTVNCQARITSLT